MATWQLQDAKARLSEVVNQAQTSGPQFITRRGTATAVVLSAEEYEVLRGRKRSFVEHLLSAPRVEGFAAIVAENRLADRRLDSKRDEELDRLF